MGSEVGVTRPLPQESPAVHEEWELETKYPACPGLESAVPSCALMSSQRVLIRGACVLAASTGTHLLALPSLP